MPRGIRISHDEFVLRLKRNNPSVSAVSEFLGFNHRVKVKHSCGTVWSVDPKNIVRPRDTGCPTCSTSKKLTKTEYVKRLKLMGSTIRPIEFLGGTLYSEHVCVQCREKKHLKPHHVLNSTGTGCLTCSSKRQRSDLNAVKAQLRTLSVGQVHLVGEYRGAKKNSEFMSKTCGHTWSQTLQGVVRSLTQGHCGCPTCSHDNASYKRVEYKLGRRTLRIQGFEHFGIDYILANSGNAADIIVSTSEGKPTIDYRFDGKQRVYFPDFYYVKRNRIVEVKSIYTLGLTRPSVFKQNVAKAKACLAQGYQFSMLVFTRSGQRIDLPKNWMDLTTSKLRAALNKV